MSSKDVVERRSAEIRAIFGVVGVSYSEDRIIVYVRDEATMHLIPPAYDGIPTQIIISGRIESL